MHLGRGRGGLEAGERAPSNAAIFALRRAPCPSNRAVPRRCIRASGAVESRHVRDRRRTRRRVSSHASKCAPRALQVGRRAGAASASASSAARRRAAALPPTVPPAGRPRCTLAGGAKGVERRAGDDDAAARGLRLLRRHRVDPVLRLLARLARRGGSRCELRRRGRHRRRHQRRVGGARGRVRLAARRREQVLPRGAAWRTAPARRAAAAARRAAAASSPPPRRRHRRRRLDRAREEAPQVLPLGGGAERAAWRCSRTTYGTRCRALGARGTDGGGGAAACASCVPSATM